MTRYAGLPGTVCLTGAGPGSAKLLTVRAVEVLKSADVVFHDDLVTEEILELIPPHVGVWNVGKRCGPKKISQEQIQECMIRAARSGRAVVRLKGGDPLVFARAQEEIAALRKNGIPFEIVPGVTAACAAAAVAEISLTDRKGASRVVFVSNHQCAGKKARLWSETFEDSTLVFYMPGGNLESLREELLENGMNSATPSLLISQAARPQQEVIRTTIRDLGSLPRGVAPSLLIVGATAAEARADLHLQLNAQGQRQHGEEMILELSEESSSGE
jgi:uroporphyrin-III C-methyltransferase